MANKIARMKNKYLESLNKIEFVVTYACTGRCKHCSEGDHRSSGERIDPEIAKDAVRRITELYDVQTVMAFGGEPLLYPDATGNIICAAKEAGVPVRQIITNGYFTKDEEKISRMAQSISEWGANDLLLSVDAFHQETIPLSVVRSFASRLKEQGVPVRLQPAWLVSPEDDNTYNVRTRQIIESLGDLKLPVSCGNVIFPEGNAAKYLAEYFTAELPENPYTEDPCNVKCISFAPNGDVLDSNVYKNDIISILENYDPKRK